MAILPIIKAPDPRLRRICAPVEQFDEKLHVLIDNMLETMYAAPGVGLAAPQIGVSSRILVMDVSNHEEKPTPLKIINPEIIDSSDSLISRDEGCLSFPEHYITVERSEIVRVRYKDENNVTQEFKAEGLTSVCIQHEIDHLDGLLFVDRISTIKKNMIMRKLKKNKRIYQK